MSLEWSIGQIMKRLEQWSAFPKYQLERRVDIFLTPFLETFVSRELSEKAPCTARLVAPEFPLLSELRKGDPAVERTNARTVNADYLLRLEGSTQGWLLLELKTDEGSFDEEQLLIYRTAQKRGMSELLLDVDFVLGRTESRHRVKYERLLAAMNPSSIDGNALHVGYLAPSALESRTHVSPFFFSLERFVAQPEEAVGLEHRELWPHVRELLNAIDRA